MPWYLLADHHHHDAYDGEDEVAADLAVAENKGRGVVLADITRKFVVVLKLHVFEPDTEPDRPWRASFTS